MCAQDMRSWSHHGIAIVSAINTKAWAGGAGCSVDYRQRVGGKCHACWVFLCPSPTRASLPTCGSPCALDCIRDQVSPEENKDDDIFSAAAATVQHKVDHNGELRGRNALIVYALNPIIRHDIGEN